jgi:hypothetical protein
MDIVMLKNLVDAGIPFILLIALGFILYRGFKKNQTLLSEREELLKRYLLFRGDKQVRLKVYGEDENVYQELLKTLSVSWKNFKKSYDQYFFSFAQNTAKTKLFLQIFAIVLLVNSVRVLVIEGLSFGLQARFFYLVVRELSGYILVILSFLLLRTQTHRFLSLKGKAVKMDREILFFPNNMSAEGEHQSLYNEFDPLEAIGEEDAKEDPNPHW